MLTTAILTSRFSCAQRGQLALRHLEPAVARHHPHLGVGARHLGADGGGQGEAHRAQAARGHERSRPLVRVVLRLPHLVLAHVGDDDRVAAGGPPQLADDVRRVELAVVGLLEQVARRASSSRPSRDLLQPRAMRRGRDERQQRFERLAHVRVQRHVDRARSCRSRRRRARRGSSARGARRSRACRSRGRRTACRAR